MAMFKNSKNRRDVRTRDVLGDSLIALMHEMPFDDITVQHLLQRAGVGRLESMATLLNRRGAAPERVAPVRELFSHVADMKDFRAALAVSGKLDDVLKLGRGIFARSIEQRLLLAGVRVEPRC